MSKRYKVLSLERGTYMKIKPRLSELDYNDPESYQPKYSVFDSRKQAEDWIEWVYSSLNRDYFEIVEFEDETV